MFHKFNKQFKKKKVAPSDKITNPEFDELYKQFKPVESYLKELKLNMANATSGWEKMKKVNESFFATHEKIFDERMIRNYNLNVVAPSDAQITMTESGYVNQSPPSAVVRNYHEASLEYHKTQSKFI